MAKKIIIALVIVLILIQFIHPAKNANTDVSPQDITRVYAVPDSVHRILQRSCYDCHSNSTTYPWYNNFQPVSWWLAYHVSKGKKHLNFSEFGTYPKKKQLKKMAQIAKSVTEGWMPLNSYLWIHKNAVLTENEKQLIANWANDVEKQISAQPDSLMSK
ncbi:MAG TPA: heme-binding domain-containing protein [Candidatus Babeliaceae bacterium]|nr:heme-binding domain-containing protein [Candidatus Babeliaceae bacterium]